MKYKIQPDPLLKSFDTLIIYRKASKWHLYSLTSGYRLSKKENTELVQWICKDKKVKPEDVRFVKCDQIIVEDLP